MNPRSVEGSADGAGLKVAVVAARFNEEITGALVSGAVEVLTAAGVPEQDILVVWVPGALELPVAARRLAEGGKVDGIVALGCVIQGETSHHEHVGREAVSGLARLSAHTGMPVGIGVLTVPDAAAARVRAGLDPDPGGGKEAGERHRGREAARACLETISVLRRLTGMRE